MDVALTSLLYRGRLVNDAEVAVLFADHSVGTQCLERVSNPVSSHVGFVARIVRLSLLSSRTYCCSG